MNLKINLNVILNKPSYKIFYPIFFLSGICSLSYELIWVKMFIPVFGVGLYSISAVVSSFMAGLAIGSYICGKVIDSKKNLPRYYSLFEFFIGLYIIALPFLLNMNRVTMPFFYNNISSDLRIFSIVKFISAFILLIIPCSLMGATLPLMSRFLVISSRGDVRKDFGFLYGLNTFGAVCGCIIVTFFMLERFGIAVSSYIIAAINIFIGTAVYLYTLNHGFDDAGFPEKSLSVTVESGLAGASFYQKISLFVAFLSGFCALSFEILLVRVLVSIFPNDAYLFPSVLIIILIASSLGAFVNSSLIKENKNYSFILGVCLILSGLIFAVTLRYFPFQLDRFTTFYLWFICFIMVFPAFLLMGIAFPALVAFYSSGNETIGHDVGNIYSINTGGAVLGSFLTAFIFIPFLGLRNTLFYCLVICILTGGIVLFLRAGKIRRSVSFLFVFALSVIFLIGGLIPDNLF
ncbi:MAG: fused MFS/spermidine synthase, partial [Candidatus Omnitrophica bacterium]|nr:fused MFS/spermidine synthase [Candidatus Omnitrophota bacterium]